MIRSVKKETFGGGDFEGDATVGRLSATRKRASLHKCIIMGKKYKIAGEMFLKSGSQCRKVILFPRFCIFTYKFQK